MLEKPPSQPPLPERKERERALNVAEVRFQGNRLEDQDFCMSETFAFGDKNVHVTIVADGHGEDGADIARESALSTFGVFEEHAAADANAITTAFQHAHAHATSPKFPLKGGATMTVAVIEGDALTMGWVGNSEARIFAQNGALEPLTTPHEYFSHPIEKARLKAMHAKIIDPRDFTLSGYAATDSEPRGHLITDDFHTLEVTRSIGDALMGPSVLHEAEIRPVALDSNSRFLLVASDGFWHALDTPVKQRHVAELLKSSNNAQEAQQKLNEFLSGVELNDNVRVVIVDVQEKK